MDLCDDQLRKVLEEEEGALHAPMLQWKRVACDECARTLGRSRGGEQGSALKCLEPVRRPLI